jgi:hypothetical protein
MKLIEDIKKEIRKFPRRSVNYFLFCLSDVLVFVFGGIAPAYWNHVELNQKIEDARSRIEESGALQPLFQSLQSVPASASYTLTMPPRGALKKSEVEGVGASFREIAGRYGMKVVSIVPDLIPAGDSHVLVVNVALKGEFENFGNVLKKIGELPYMDRIEEFTIQRSANSRALDITMQIILAVN